MSDIKLFENKQIRSEWDEEEQKWYFSNIDVVEILTESKNPRRYWSDLKIKLQKEGFTQFYEIIVQLKLKSADVKKYITDCATSQSLLRIIQSIPSPKAEPFKLWLAQVGSDNGNGILKNIVDTIFQPFFTTKTYSARNWFGFEFKLQYCESAWRRYKIKFNRK